MDTITIFFSYLSPILLLILPLSLYLFCFGRQSHGRLKNPPGSTGWPIIGEMMDYALSGPDNFVIKRMSKFSPDVFKTCLVGEKMAFFCGAQGNNFFFTNGNKVMTTWLPKSLKKTLLYPEYIDVPLKDAGALLQRIGHHVLKPDILKQYIPIMDSLAREHLEKHWSTHSEVKLFPLSKIYSFRLTCKLLMGIDDPQIIERLMKIFSVVTEGIFSIPIDFPGTGLNRAIKAGALLREEFMKMVTLRKSELIEKETTVGKDLLSVMILQTDVKGQFFNEMDVVNTLIALILAAYEAPSVALAFVLKNLSEHPDIYEKVLAEQMDISKSKTPGELLNWDDIHKMTYSWNVFRESLRLALPANGGGGFREVITDFTFAGFTIPKGWKTFWSVHTTHRDPKYFPNPEKFDPSRFERNVPEPYTFVPFGGGPHMCPGREYAKLEVLVFIHNVVNMFKLEKLFPDEKILYYGTPVPVKGFPVRLLRHQ